MNTWQQLQVAALLGTQKNTPTPQWPQELAPLMTQLTDKPLLQQLAAMSVYQRCAFSPMTMAAPTPSLPETLHAATPLQQKWLSYLLSSEGKEYLPHWLTLAAAQQVAFPASQLPQLLGIGNQNKKFRLAIAQVVGQRGAWLAAQNSDWQWLQGGQCLLEDEQLNAYWHTASAACRELLFERLRLAYPAQARELLQQVWHEETASTRKLLLEKLTLNLSHDDHDFLESCLDNRNRSVKEQAIDLLARLQGSLLQQRMQQVCSQHITLKKGVVLKKLDIVPLEQLSDTLERDGLHTTKADIKNSLGEKAQWLRDVVACVSLTWLCEHYEMQAEAFISAALKTDWAEAILTGLSMAAIRQKQAVWLCALLDVNSQKLLLPRFRLFDALNTTNKEQYLLAAISHTKKNLERTMILSSFLSQSQAWFWSSYFTVAIMDIYQQPSNLPSSHSLELYLARYGDAQLALNANQYPPQIVSTWLMRLEIEQAFSV